MREPLLTRVMADKWTDFERQLFNLVTQCGDREEKFYFSARLHVTQAMLDAYDLVMDALVATHQARPKNANSG